MATAVNLIDGASATFMQNRVPSLGGWVAEVGGIRPNMKYRKTKNFDSLRLYPEVGGNSCAFYLDGIPSIGRFNSYQFHAFATVVGEGIGLTTINTEFSCPSLSQSILSANSIGRSERGDEWFIIRSRVLELPPDGNSYNLKVRFSFEFEEDTEVYFTKPTLIPYIHYLENGFLNRVYNFIPDFLIDLDFESNATGDLPDFLMTRYMDFALQTHDEVEDDFDSISYIDIEDGRIETNLDTYSTLVDWQVMRRKFVKWVANATGNNLRSPGLVATPWGNLPDTWYEMMEEIDPTANPTIATSSLSRTNPTITPSALTRAANVVTATVSSTEHLELGDFIEVAGTASTENSFNGIFRVSGLGPTTISWDDEGANETATDEGTITPKLGLVTASVSSSTGFEEDNYVTVEGTSSAGNSFNGNFKIYAVTSTTIKWKQEGATESSTGGGNITLLDSEWIEIMGFDPDVIDILDYQRWIISTQVFGTMSGTRLGLEAAIERNLINQKRYSIIYNYEGDPWTIKIESVTGDTDFGEEGFPNNRLLGAIELCRPCGFLFVHECISVEAFEA